MQVRFGPVLTGSRLSTAKGFIDQFAQLLLVIVTDPHIERDLIDDPDLEIGIGRRVISLRLIRRERSEATRSRKSMNRARSYLKSSQGDAHGRIHIVDGWTITLSPDLRDQDPRASSEARRAPVSLSRRGSGSLQHHLQRTRASPVGHGRPRPETAVAMFSRPQTAGRPGRTEVGTCRIPPPAGLSWFHVVLGRRV